MSWAVLGGIIAVILLPGMISLLRDVEPLYQNEIAERKAHAPKLRLWRDPKFYYLLPGNLFIPCVLTALFLYRLPLARYRGWSAGTMASALVGFAVARMAASLAIGPVIDRWGAVRLLSVVAKKLVRIPQR